jgi:hypothetical protein
MLWGNFSFLWVRARVALGFAASLLLVTLAGCGGDDYCVNNCDAGVAANQITNCMATPLTAAGIMSDVFSSYGCGSSDCHGSQRKANLDLSTQAGMCASLKAGSASCEAPGTMRTNQSSPKDSYLVQKLTCNADGSGSCASSLPPLDARCKVPTDLRMPAGGAEIDSTCVTALSNWIAKGMPGCN